MPSSVAARRYARALFSLAKDAGEIPDVGEQLAFMVKLFEDSPELKAGLFRPLHPVKERSAVLREVGRELGLKPTVQSFMLYLIDQCRLVDFDGICDEYRRLSDEAAGLVRAEIVTSSPLSEEQRGRLERALATRTGRRVDLEVRVDPDLIGGAVAVVGGVLFDGSLKTQLSQLRESLQSGGGATTS